MLKIKRITDVHNSLVAAKCMTLSNINQIIKACLHGSQSNELNLIHDQELDIFSNAKDFEHNIAIIDNNGSFTYETLLNRSTALASMLCKKIKSDRLIEKGIMRGPRISFLCPNNFSYVVAQWAIWKVRGIAVPLYKSHPASLLKYYISDSGASTVITTQEYSPSINKICQELDIEHFELDQKFYLSNGGITQSDKFIDNLNKDQCGDDESVNHPFVGENNDIAAQILYSSGTTGKPKGVISTYRNIRLSVDDLSDCLERVTKHIRSRSQAQVEALIKAWNWTPSDKILHVLPLHHLHGIINCLVCPLWAGATCIMLPEFNAEEVWQTLQGETPKSLMDHGVEISSENRPNVFMAVPTIYSKLIQSYDQKCLDQKAKDRIREKMKKIRLMVSGSSALPEPVMKRWKDITGHTLLERYGMTEIGMGLSNPLTGERRPGAVGIPLPGVEVQIAAIASENDTEYRVAAFGDENGTEVTPGLEECEGELLIRGDNVFKEYWNKPDATKEAFTKDGWFKTGDTAIFKNGMYQILGRTSVDIIKRGGYKISALDIERQLLSHDAVLDCAVVGVPDEVWGQVIAAVIVFKDGKALGLEELQRWATDYLAPYSIPTVLKTLDSMPRNQMGKINKKELLRDLFSVRVGTTKKTGS